MIEIKIAPVPKPRMTVADKWRHRSVVDRYFAFKDAINLICNKNKFKLTGNYKVEFLMPIPKSWPEKKKQSLHGQPHQQKPDLDNLLKALNDCLLKEDKEVWKIEACKVWWDEGKILIWNK
jgi:Holliday junction resolvase RusA-like endonuclease